ncbi:MAG: hypothetical protein FJ130_04135 [Deltaproteobacteria bacterium]|nr:hypothetical protein [Deltaproteobacteria bacterium]
MSGFIFDKDGNAVGVRLDPYIFDLEGNPIGQLLNNYVFTLSGKYIGEFHKDMILDKNINPGNVSPQINVGKIREFRNPGNRGKVDYGYPDVFHRLLETD